LIKKLDKLIIKAFIGPFFATFLISLFVLVMQFFWLYIDDLVGKGLDLFTIFKLIGYVAAFNVSMALPLALLLSSIMTFGNLGESFELVAIKSAGIPLTRFMRPLFLVTVGLSGVAFLFANNIIPVINLKLNALKYDIIVTKPAFDIKEGIFYNKIEGFVIKIGKKEKDDSTIRNVVIYEKSYGLQDQMLIAESGIMRVTPDKKYLEFILHNGWRYEEKGARYTVNTDFIRLGFKEYKKVMDLSSFSMSKTEDTLFKYDAKMLSVRQLNQTIDSLSRDEKRFYERTKREVSIYFNFARVADSNWASVKHVPVKKAKSLDSLLTDSMRTVVNERALSQLNNISSSVQQIAADYKSRHDLITRHWIEWNRKFTLSAGCLVLFMIGAPLGSIIRKGGLGMPLIFAIIFFVVFYILNTIGEKMAKEGVTTPGGGMWLSTFVLIPIGVFLTYKAMRDSQLFNKEGYYRAFKRLKQWVGRKN
jgi:lipopolysaccharide export system permease protein